jgi:hypothetical protein
MLTGGSVDRNNFYKKFGDDNLHLVKFDLSALDDYEEMQFNHFSKSSSKAESLQILINNVEGDYSQLSPTLSKIAEEQYPSDEFFEENRQYVKGGSVDGGDYVREDLNFFENGGRVWTKEQREKVAKLDKEFIEYVKEKGIQRNSYEASLLWREGGFKKRMGEIFGKEYGKYAKGGYTRPSYKINTTGFFSFKTKDKEYIVRSSFFERKNDIEDSLQIQDELRGELGSIIITNSAWKRLSDGNTIKARSNRGNLTGTLTRVANLNENYSLNKMANGGGVEEWTNNLKYLTSKKVYFDINSGKIYPKINYKPNMSKGKNVDEFGNKWFDSLNDRDLSTIQIYLNNRKSMAKGGGLIRKAPFKVGDMVYSYQNPNHKMRVAFVEDRGIEDGVDYGWGIRVALKTDANGNYDPNGSYSKTSKYMSQNSVSKTKKDSYSTGGMVEFYDYKGIEIMYEPTYKEYYANDMVFYSLEDAHEYIDSGEANKTPKHIENLYRRGAMAKGGNVGSQDLYKLAEEMSEKDFRNKFLTLSKSEKDNVESLIRLGDDKKLALITILDKRNEPNNDDFYRQAYHYKKGGSVNKKVYIDLFEDYENIPANVQMILDEYSESFEDGDYIGMSKAQDELEQIGYTFNFYVDGDAYGLRPIGIKLSQLKGYEDADEE